MTKDTLEICGIAILMLGSIVLAFWMIYQIIIDDKNREEFLRNLKIGDKFVSDIQLTNEDPFEEKQTNLITIEVLDIKANEENTVWAKVKWSDDNITTMQAMQIYEDFTKI